MSASASKILTILCDRREQTPPPLPPGCCYEPATLPTADYTTHKLRSVAVVERKSVCDFASTITHHRDRFDREVERLHGFRWKAIVVEGNIFELWKVSAVHPHSVIGSIASFYARHDVPTLFVGNEVLCGRMIAGLLTRWEARLEDGEPERREKLLEGAT